MKVLLLGRVNAGRDMCVVKNMTHVTELELNTRAFAPPFVHIPFIPVVRTKECQECAHIFLQVGSSAVRFKNVPLTTESKISLRSRSCSPAIIPRVRMGYESIAHEAKGRMGYWLIGYEGERNNCFSKIQLFDQKNIETKHLSQVKAGHQSFFTAKTLQIWLAGVASVTVANFDVLAVRKREKERGGRGEGEPSLLSPSPLFLFLFSPQLLRG